MNPIEPIETPEAPSPNSTSDLESPMLEPQEFISLKEGFVAYKTRSKGRTEDENDDAGLADNKHWYRVMAVADGVGMSTNPSIASKTVIQTFQQYVASLEIRSGITDFQDISKFYTEASREIEQALIAKDLSPQSGVTTFIGLIEYTNHYVVTYLGDGSIYWATQTSDGLNKGAVQILLTAPLDAPPQMGAKGKSEDHQTIIISKPKDKGFIWIIASDGMNDFERFMEDRSKVKGVEAVKLLVQEIWESFQHTPDQFTSQSIENVLERWIKRCQTTDDATIAMLISEEMFANWQGLVNKKSIPENLSTEELFSHEN